jgi:hypothetical protein
MRIEGHETHTIIYLTIFIIVFVIICLIVWFSIMSF